MGDRQRVIETNRSLRNIKNELESLLEKGVIDDDTYETISGLLPAESSFNSRSTPAPRANTTTTATSLPTPASTPAATAAPPPTAAMAALSVGGNANPPPSYAQSTSTTTGGPPALPGRNPPPAAAAPPSKPIIAHARALYKYSAADARDCSFDKDDRIAVFEYMNADWWMGRNQRSGQEGIFPRSYVVVEDEKAAQPAAVLYPHQPAQPVYGQPAGGYGQPAGYGVGYPGAPPAGQQQQQQQQGEEGGSKMGEHGKKFGKKLGNAAIFGAGATIGSNIVNSIF
ncbi:SH3 domain-containing protein [Cercophora samala]|uniref:SH3 domain-containing protein n=1 Tax=Cercophora samala TaxID=330535 RepID=A0AA39Z0P0_9PEZI|nr:SH3 domain-containing protein [Cercophora samala]